jgi:hypothetical protein
MSYFSVAINDFEFENKKITSTIIVKEDKYFTLLYEIEGEPGVFTQGTIPEQYREFSESLIFKHLQFT